MCAEAPEVLRDCPSASVVRKDERLEATSEWPGRRNPSARHPGGTCSPAFSGVQALDGCHANPAPECAIHLARRSAYTNNAGRVRIGREISRSADGAFGVSFPRPSDRGDRSQSSRLSSTTLASPKDLPPNCNGSGTGTARSRSILSMPDQRWDIFVGWYPPFLPLTALNVVSGRGAREMLEHDPARFVVHAALKVNLSFSATARAAAGRAAISS